MREASGRYLVCLSNRCNQIQHRTASTPKVPMTNQLAW
jgi:hypothetical protein